MRRTCPPPGRNGLNGAEIAPASRLNGFAPASNAPTAVMPTVHNTHCLSTSVPSAKPPCQKPQPMPHRISVVNTMVNHGMRRFLPRNPAPRTTRPDRACPRAGNGRGLAGAPRRLPQAPSSHCLESRAVSPPAYWSRSSIRREYSSGLSLANSPKLDSSMSPCLSFSISSSPTSSLTNRLAASPAPSFARPPAEAGGRRDGRWCRHRGR